MLENGIFREKTLNTAKIEQKMQGDTISCKSLLYWPYYSDQMYWHEWSRRKPFYITTVLFSVASTKKIFRVCTFLVILMSNTFGIIELKFCLEKQNSRAFCTTICQIFNFYDIVKLNMENIFFKLAGNWNNLNR